MCTVQDIPKMGMLAEARPSVEALLESSSSQIPLSCYPYRELLLVIVRLLLAETGPSVQALLESFSSQIHKKNMNDFLKVISFRCFLALVGT